MRLKARKDLVKLGLIVIVEKRKSTRMKKIYVFLFCLISAGLLQAQTEALDTVSFGIKDAWERANAYSKELQETQIDAEIGKEKVLDAKRNWLPKVEAEASYGQLSNIPVFVDGILEEPENIPIEDHTTYEASIQAYLNLYSGGKVKRSVKKAETQESMQEYITQASQSELHYKVAQSYLDILRSKEFEKIIEQNINRNNKRLEQITQLYKNGVVLKSDLLRAQLQLSQQNTNLHEMKNNVEIATQKLNMMLGFEDDYPLSLTDSIPFDVNELNKLYDDYVGLALDKSPFLKIAQTQLALSKLENKEVKSDKLPQIGLFGEYAYSYPQIMLYPYETAPYLLGVAGIKISYDLSSLYSNKHKESVAKLEVKKQEVAEENTKELLRTRIKTAYKRLQEDKENIEVGKIEIQQAEENYRIVNHTYFNKLALLTDLLAADTQLLQAQFNLVNSYVSARLHYYQLLKITGQL